MGDEGDADDEGEEGKVIDAEIGVVFAEAGGGFSDGFRFREGGAVDEFSPWTALRVTIFDLVVEAGDEGSDSGGCDLRIGGFDGGGGGGGGRDGGGFRLWGGDREDWWGRSSH